MGGCGALRRCGCAWTYERTQFLCVKYHLGSAGEPTICSHCYSVPYMKIPANNQVFFMFLRFHNSLTLGRCGSNFRSVISEHMLQMKYSHPHFYADKISSLLVVKASLWCNGSTHRRHHCYFVNWYFMSVQCLIDVAIFDDILWLFQGSVDTRSGFPRMAKPSDGSGPSPVYWGTLPV